MTSSEILNWDKNIVVDEDIEEYEYLRYPPNAGGVAMLNTPGEIRFNIESDSIFTHPHRSYLQFEGQIEQKDSGDKFEPADLITFANNGLMFLFSQIRYELGGREIETLLFPGQATTMLGLLEYTDDFAVSRGFNQCWFKDSLFYTNTGVLEAGTATRDNKGFKARHDLLISSITEEAKRGSFTFNVPLSHIFGFCKDFDKVLYGLKHELILTRKVDEEPIFQAGPKTPEIKLNNIFWFVPQTKPSIEQNNILMEEMRKGVDINIGFDHRQVFSVGLPVGNNSYTWTLTTKSAAEKPRFIIIGFQKTKRTDKHQNPSVFNHLNLLEIHAFLNNVRKYPVLNFQMDFSKNSYADAFNAAANFRCLVEGLPSCVSNFGINPLDFKSLYPIYVLDVSKQSADIKTSTTHVTVDMKFRQNIEPDTRAYAVLLSDKVYTLKAEGKNLKPVF